MIGCDASGLSSIIIPPDNAASETGIVDLDVMACLFKPSYELEDM